VPLLLHSPNLVNELLSSLTTAFQHLLSNGSQEFRQYSMESNQRKPQLNEVFAPFGRDYNFFNFGGGSGIRTQDPLRARQVL